MDYVKINKINNYLIRYGIENNENNFKKLEEVISKHEYYHYKRILYMIDNCMVINKDSTGILIEIDLWEHNTLLEDLIKKFFTKKIST